MNADQQVPRTAAGQAFVDLVLETFRFNGRILAAGDRLTKEFGITSALWQVLGAIDAQPLTVAQIARNMGLARQSVRRSAKILEHKGLIAFMENPDHKRANLAMLTQAGRAVLDRVREVEIKWSNEIGAGFDAVQMSTLVELMQKLAQRL